MPKVKKLSALTCFTGCCGRRRKIYEEDEDNFIFSQTASIESIDLEISTHELQIADFISEETMSSEKCPEVRMGTAEVTLVVPPEIPSNDLLVQVPEPCPTTTASEEAMMKTVRFGSSDADFIEESDLKTPNKSYRKTPKKILETTNKPLLDEKQLDDLATRLVQTAIRSALSYFLATLSVRRALDASSTFCAADESLSEEEEEEEQDSSSDESDEENIISVYVDSLLNRIIDTIETNEKLSKDADNFEEIGDGMLVDNEKNTESTGEAPVAKTSLDKSPISTLTQSNPTFGSQSEMSVTGTSCSSLEWDNYDVTTNPTIQYEGVTIPTE